MFPFIYLIFIFLGKESEKILILHKLGRLYRQMNHGAVVGYDNLLPFSAVEAIRKDRANGHKVYQGSFLGPPGRYPGRCWGNGLGLVTLM